MKFLTYFILFLALAGSFCLNKFKIKATKSKQKLLPIPENLEEFPDSILAEINQYLALYQYSELAMMDKLKETSTRLIIKQIVGKLAAEEIISHNSFGQHSSIQQWQAQLPNDIFTEMCFNVNVTNSNYYSKSLSQKTSKIMYDTKMSVGTIMKTPVAPTPEMFAKNIIETLETENLMLTLNQYSNCGISVVAMDQTKYPNEYLTVVHLIKSNVMTSCKDAAAKGLVDQDVELEINGEKKTVHCGKDGWALVQTVKQDLKTGGILKIDDQGLDYSEIYIVASEQNTLDQNTGNNDWKSILYQEKWYNCQKWPDSVEKWAGFENFGSQIKNYSQYPLSDIESYKHSDTCKYRSENHPDFCSLEFKLKVQDGKKLTAIADYEKLTGSNQSDNSIIYDFQLFVR